MKRVSLMVVCIGIFFACTGSHEQVKVPYADNYETLSGLEHCNEWGAYNVHDPSCKKFGKYYYVYSTDAYYGKVFRDVHNEAVKIGNIPYRRSEDLVHWKFCGWAIDSIPVEAVEYVRTHNHGWGGYNVWAPYVLQYKDKYRMYYCVSAFGKNISYLGLLEAVSPEGPWENVGGVLSTSEKDSMNAIDPTVVTDAVTGEQWMIYGSYFGGLYCVQLDPETGMTLNSGDRGKCIATRYNVVKNNIEAPEAIYCPENGYYYLFVSYDPLMTTYNIRVGRSRHPQGPYLDCFGNDMKKATDNFPLLTYAYRFRSHPGWAGTGHCSVMSDGKGYYVFHQGRLSPENAQIIMHVRRIFWTKDGWPVFSPERYAGVPLSSVRKKEMFGDWEIIHLKNSHYKRSTMAGQVLEGENHLAEEEVCVSQVYHFNRDGSIEGYNGKWKTDEQVLQLDVNGIKSEDLILHRGLDWENNKETVLFTGLDVNGFSIWGKRIN